LPLLATLSLFATFCDCLQLGIVAASRLERSRLEACRGIQT
jgi:hypothetical protein